MFTRLCISFRPIELIQLAFLLVMSVLQIAYWERIPHAGVHLLVYALVVTVMLLARRAASEWECFPTRVVYWFLPIAVVLAVYFTEGEVISAMWGKNGEWLEPSLVRLDRWMFGVDPSVWLERVYHPVVLDIFEVCYVLFYVFPVGLIAVLYWQGRRREFDDASTILSVHYYFLYVCYMIFPVLGPHANIEVARLYQKDIAAEGGPITALARAFIESAETLTHDVFPSGHTSVAVLSTILAFRWAPSLGWVYAAPAAMLVFSTVLLRYHYVGDLLAGVLAALLALVVGGCLARVLNHLREKHGAPVVADFSALNKTP